MELGRLKREYLCDIYKPNSITSSSITHKRMKNEPQHLVLNSNASGLGYSPVNIYQRNLNKKSRVKKTSIEKVCLEQENFEMNSRLCDE